MIAGWIGYLREHIGELYRIRPCQSSREKPESLMVTASATAAEFLGASVSMARSLSATGAGVDGDNSSKIMACRCGEQGLASLGADMDGGANKVMMDGVMAGVRMVVDGGENGGFGTGDDLEDLGEGLAGFKELANLERSGYATRIDSSPVRGKVNTTGMEGVKVVSRRIPTAVDEDGMGRDPP